MDAASYDAVVVGAGPNGLVAANHLVDQGWSVLVLEANPHPGGAVASDTDVHPGFVHDTFSAFYPLAAASPVIQSLRLEEHGVRWLHAPAVLGHPRSDGSWAILHRDREVTAGLLEAACAGDGAAWLALCEPWDGIETPLVGALLAPFPPVRAGLQTLARLPRAGGFAAVGTLLSSAIKLGRTRFGGADPRLLLAGNAAHTDLALDSMGSGLLGLMLTMLGQTVGFPVPEGGAGRLTDALVRRLTSRGGELRCDTEVTGIVVDRGHVVAVQARSGERFDARTVIADVAAPHLYGRLLDPGDVPARVERGMRTFAMDPATVKVDWALGGPVPWLTQPAHAPGAVHVADSVEEISESMAQVAAGAIPASPFLVAGQMTTSDPSRSPLGTESMWAYAHVPQESRSDAGDGSIRGVWDRDDAERFADRMQARIERLAPGFGSQILARRVLGPRELEARNANLIGGAVGGGTAQLHQQLVFRPVPGLGRAETGIAGLYLGSASAHPGGGVHGACGMNAARAAVRHSRRQLGGQ